MRLTKLQEFMKARSMPFTYREEDDCGAIDFIHKGLSYHIWEYPAPDRGAESNLESCGKMKDYEGDYEEALLSIMKTW